KSYRMGRQRRQSFFRGGGLADQQFAFGSAEFHCEHECVVALPTILPKQNHSSTDIDQRGAIGRCRFSTISRNQIQASYKFTLLWRCYEFNTTVKLIHDLEDIFFALFHWSIFCQQSANPQMDSGSLIFREKSIRCFLDPVVQECVRVISAGDKPYVHSLPER